MRMDPGPLGLTERVSFTLRGLYSRRGYTHYKMSKFEEYDLYARNKDFLISDSVLTFTDASGRLLALKPDVTLSIVKNSKDTDGVEKVYYTENVYRADKSTHAFKELLQVGLECIGCIDDYQMAEVLTLAAQSLASISSDWLLDISHVGLLSDLLDSIGIPAADKAQALRLVGEKNIHELAALCRRAGLDPAGVDCLTALVNASGRPEEVLPALEEKLAGVVDTAPLAWLTRLVSAVEDPALRNRLRVDFSVVDNIKYYNGLVFKGFVEGVPAGVLSGGQYDNLLARMGRASGAVGFAVYLDRLEQLDALPAYDVDAVLLYDEGEDLSLLSRTVETLTSDGSRVMAQRCLPTGVRYARLLRLEKGQVKTVEQDA